MSRVCAYCGVLFEAKRAICCSYKCRSQYAATFKVTCSVCRTECYMKKSDFNRRKTDLCHTCFNTSRSGKSHLAGEKNPNWHGGFRYYSKGRFGKDQEGLPWKNQRRLCWERDNYTCQSCHLSREETGPLWHPSVHHITPWRCSHSHALQNLLCLCRKCHGLADRQWDKLHPTTGPLEPIKSRIRNTKEPAKPSMKQKALEAKDMYLSGLTQKEIAVRFSVTQASISNWLKSVS